MEYEKIKRLIDDMGGSKLSALEIDFPDGTRISMKKDNGAPKIMDESEKKFGDVRFADLSETREVVNVKNEVKVEEKSDDDGVYRYIKSPMVGTFYSKPSPNEKSFLEVGKQVKKGATTCIIEAMKLMNEIESEFDGEVVEFLKKDGEPVEYGENLIKIK